MPSDKTTTLLFKCITKIATYCNDKDIKWKTSNVNHRYHELYNREAQFVMKLTLNKKFYYLYFNDIYAIGSFDQGVESQFSSISIFSYADFEKGPLHKTHIESLDDVDDVINFIKSIGGE